MKCDNCSASKLIKDSMGCNADQLYNRFEILKAEIAKLFKIKYRAKFQCRFADLVEMERRSEGKWIVDYDSGSIVLSCSICDEHYWMEDDRGDRPVFCPNCGARMDGD